mmetsp:Transcript_3420/g.5040  ORF Transcript_3420/g.5040 Transcript_3420/m.5040 type:complete len:380 (+) Transcript_3420:27-1166(+)
MSDIKERKSLRHSLRVFFYSMGRTKIQLLFNVLIGICVFSCSFFYFFNGIFFPSIFSYNTSISLKEASHHMDVMFKELYEEDFSGNVFLPKSEKIFHTKKKLDIEGIWNYISSSSPLVLKSYFSNVLVYKKKPIFHSISALKHAHSFTYTQYNVLELVPGQDQVQLPHHGLGYLYDTSDVSQKGNSDVPIQHTMTFSTFLKHFETSGEFKYYLPWSSFTSFSLPEHMPKAVSYLNSETPPQIQFIPEEVEFPLRQLSHETFFCQAHGAIDMVLLDPLETNALKSLGFANNHIGLRTDKIDASINAIERFSGRIKELNVKFFELAQNDCVFIPAYWWMAFSTKTPSIQARYLYRPHSSFVDTAFRVVRDGEISTENFQSS